MALTQTQMLAAPQAARYGYGAMVPPATLFRPVSLRRRATVLKIVQARAQSLRSETQDATSSNVDLRTVASPPEYSSFEAQNYIGSPALWIGVGVGISVLFSWAASYIKKQAMQQALKSMMTPGPSPFPTMPGQPFPFPVAPQQPLQPAVGVGSSKTVVIEPSVSEASVEVQTAEFKATTDGAASDFPAQKKDDEEPKVYFTDPEVKDSGSTFGWSTDGASSSTSADGKPSYFSVETLEKMLEDPTVQQMVYPYLPEEMRNPSTFKWMMQNPQFRTQLQEMLNGMTTEDGAWNSGNMADVLKNFNPNNQELKQQFEQIGLSPEEVMAKMVANPEIAMAFQNPKIQAALIDCSQNPANIQKYQDDKEIMDVFNKIAELFPIK